MEFDMLKCAGRFLNNVSFLGEEEAIDKDKNLTENKKVAIHLAR